MTYLLGIAVITLGATNLAALWMVFNLLERQRIERQELADRVMALSQPVALAQVAANRDETPIKPVRIVGGEYEFGLRRGATNAADATSSNAN